MAASLRTCSVTICTKMITQVDCDCYHRDSCPHCNGYWSERKLSCGAVLMKTPPELDRITDAVLAYRPKDKQQKRRKKKRKPNGKKS
jgi:hypothetical protein